MSEEKLQIGSQSSLTPDQISEILSKCYPGLSQPLLSPEQAASRGIMVYEDMATVRFPLALGETWPVNVPGYEDIFIPSYPLPGISYGPVADPDGTEGRDAAGPLLSCGEFIRLSRACVLGRELLGTGQWPNQFTRRLRHPDDHLVVVEEVLWLGRWISPQHIRSSYRQNPENDKDIDWRFKSCEMIINFEVKYRRRDWMGVTDGEHFSRDFDSYFNDVEGKFAPRPEDERNVLGVTTLTPADQTLRRATNRFLLANPQIDAVVFWSLHDPEGRGPEVIGRDADLIRTFINEPSREETLFISVIRHLWRRREERRAIRADEVPELLRGLHESE